MRPRKDASSAVYVNTIVLAVLPAVTRLLSISIPPTPSRAKPLEGDANSSADSATAQRQIRRNVKRDPSSVGLRQSSAFELEAKVKQSCGISVGIACTEDDGDQPYAPSMS